MDTKGTSTEETPSPVAAQIEEVLIKTHSLDITGKNIDTSAEPENESTKKAAETSTKESIDKFIDDSDEESVDVKLKWDLFKPTNTTIALVPDEPYKVDPPAKSEESKEIAEGASVSENAYKFDITKVESLPEDTTSNDSILKLTGVSVAEFVATETKSETQEKIPSRVFFYLYTRRNPENPQLLEVDNHKVLNSSEFDVSEPTKMVTHGWFNNYKGLNCETIRKAFLQHGNYNVIVVDWGVMANTPYDWSCSRLKAVGTYIASMINFLGRRGCDLNNLTLVGHSLGAHLMGFAGRSTKGIVGHLVGLDPALPRFRHAESSDRIAKGDARLVEIIHTNAGQLGLAAPVGNLDFYPNGGAKQPGCTNDEDGNISHARAYEYYAENINSEEGFFGMKADNYDCFLAGRYKTPVIEKFPGANPEKKQNGCYFLRTLPTSPYSMGIDGTKPAPDLTCITISKEEGTNLNCLVHDQ